MTTTVKRAEQTRPRDGFAQLVRAEWTKLHTVRGWAAGLVCAGLVIVAFAVLTGVASRSTYSDGPGAPDIVGHPDIPIGPGGEAVVDSFLFVHRTLSGDGSITVRLASMTGGQHSLNGPSGPADLQPWAKAGLIVKNGLVPGSSYAAVLRSGAHGVRMQYDFTGDIAGPTDADPWLRLSRVGSTVTAEASANGDDWTAIGSVQITLSENVEAGLFATSPTHRTVAQQLGGGGSVTAGGSAFATATFDSVTLTGNWGTEPWVADAIGTGPLSTDASASSGFSESGATISVTGSGDIAPDTGEAGTPIERVLVGGFGALTITAVLAALFMTTEYRRSMIRTTFAASPRRGRVLAAKAVVIGGVTFLTGLLATAVALPLSRSLLEANGNFVLPTSAATQLRLTVGTAAVLSVTAVFALAIGAILRRGAMTVVVVVVLAILPYLLAVAAVLPAGPSQWLLRVMPAAGFAVQQTMVAYPQVDGAYIPAFGFFPLAPWSGFAVLCGYAALALGIAVVLLRRRDA